MFRMSHVEGSEPQLRVQKYPRGKLVALTRSRKSCFPMVGKFFPALGKGFPTRERGNSYEVGKGASDYPNWETVSRKLGEQLPAGKGKGFLAERSDLRKIC